MQTREQIVAELREAFFGNGNKPTVDQLFERLVIERMLLLQTEADAIALGNELDKRMIPTLWVTRDLEGDVNGVTEEEPLHFVAAYVEVKQP